ncbi:Uncharacterised protein [Mycolicibacterium flavescens]|uniref:hypothetical protein n=1 Tax=Mycobacterium neumannii TaxID=2048551 RepID=UPI000B94431E|nr:hypothetical protein [Mycobacterium neumannii]VEG41070.1 Uncharacterised protein [Mycolicibacterium flavescens]
MNIQYTKDDRRSMRRLLENEVLIRALQQARDGILSPQWRDTLEENGALADAPDFQGVHGAVIATIQAMPLAAWEPGVNSETRSALDRWYHDASDELGKSYEHRLRTHARTAAIGIQVQNLKLLSCSLRAQDPAPALRMDVPIVDDVQGKALRELESEFIVKRDTLLASYLAALATTGMEVDWRSWFEERIASWEDRTAADLARISLHARVFEQIPAYW